MEFKALVLLFQAVIREGAQKALSGCDNAPDWLTKTEAYRLHGRSNVDRWFSEGLLKSRECLGKPTKKIVNRIQLEKIAGCSNRMTYLPVAER